MESNMSHNSCPDLIHRTGIEPHHDLVDGVLSRYSLRLFVR